jgi:hypothetical protein
MKIRLNTSGFQVCAECRLMIGLVSRTPWSRRRYQRAPHHPHWHLAHSGPIQWREQPVGANSDFPFLENIEAMDLTLFQTWGAQHVAEILYLQYFYLVVYSDDGSLIACSPMIYSTYGKICLNAPRNQLPV